MTTLSQAQCVSSSTSSSPTSIPSRVGPRTREVIQVGRLSVKFQLETMLVPETEDAGVGGWDPRRMERGYEVVGSLQVE
jgi:hypothetical protein